MEFIIVTWASDQLYTDISIFVFDLRTNWLETQCQIILVWASCMHSVCARMRHWCPITMVAAHSWECNPLPGCRVELETTLHHWWCLCTTLEATLHHWQSWWGAQSAEARSPPPQSQASRATVMWGPETVCVCDVVSNFLSFGDDWWWGGCELNVSRWGMWGGCHRDGPPALDPLLHPDMDGGQLPGGQRLPPPPRPCCGHLCQRDRGSWGGRVAREICLQYRYVILWSQESRQIIQTKQQWAHPSWPLIPGNSKRGRWALEAEKWLDKGAGHWAGLGRGEAPLPKIGAPTFPWWAARVARVVRVHRCGDRLPLAAWSAPCSCSQALRPSL